MNGNEVTGLLREMLTELRAIREAVEATDEDYEGEEDEGYEDEEEDEEED